MFETVTLSNGELVRVYPVPSFAIAAAVGTVPLPEPPILLIKTLSGEQPYPDTSPESQAYQEYTRKRQAAEAARGVKQNEISLLVALKDIEPPEGDDWFLPMAYVGVNPREGSLGRKLDYIQYVLLASAADLKAVFDTITAISFPREERIEAVKASFPDRGRRNGAVSGDFKPAREGAERGDVRDGV